MSRKPLSLQLEKEEPLNAQRLDELLQRKQAKAEKYAGESARFPLISLELEMRADHGNCEIHYDHGQLSCTCDSFEGLGTCSHLMALLLLLKDSLFCGFPGITDRPKKRRHGRNVEPQEDSSSEIGITECELV